MVWVWIEEDSEKKMDHFKNSNYSEDRCSTRKIVKSNCKTEEVEKGKFMLKCQKTEQILRDCVGRPTEVIESFNEYTEEDVSDQMKNGSHSTQLPQMAPFDFPGLRGDIEALERSFLGGLRSFFEAAEEMKNGFFGAIDSPGVFDGDSSSMSSPRRGIPIEDFPRKEAPQKTEKSGEFDLSGLAKDV